jgi:hypothetical protein
VSPILGIYASQISGHLFAPSGAYDSIATATFTGSALSVTFSSIPSTYTHLQIRGLARTPSGNDQIDLRFNGDSGNNYSMHGLSGDGASTAAEGYGTQNRIFAVNSPVTNADVYCVSVIDILDYANTNKNTTVRTLQGRDTNGAGILALNSGAWYNTAAVTSITLAARVYNPTSISSFALYGIKGGN